MKALRPAILFALIITMPIISKAQANTALYCQHLQQTLYNAVTIDTEQPEQDIEGTIEHLFSTIAVPGPTLYKLDIYSGGDQYISETVFNPDFDGNLTLETAQMQLTELTDACITQEGYEREKQLEPNSQAWVWNNLMFTMIVRMELSPVNTDIAKPKFDEDYYMTITIIKELSSK